MGKRAVAVLYVLVMAAVIVGVDILFFKNHLWERLAVNIKVWAAVDDQECCAVLHVLE